MPLDTTILACLAEGVIAVSAEGRVLRGNPAAATLLGHAPAPAMPENFLAANGLDPIPGHEGPLPGLAALAASGPLRLAAANGAQILSVTASAFRGERGAEGFVVVLRDIQALVREETARAAAQAEQARRRETFLQTIVDHVADPIFVKDQQFRFVYLSRALCEMVGFPREAMIGKTDYDFFPKEQADYFRKRDTEMFRSEAVVVIEEEPITDASGKLHWLATTKVPLRFESDEVTHLVGVIHDITRLKGAEAALSEKNEALAEQVARTTSALAEADLANRDLLSFASAVSHDLRAPLRAVTGYLQVLVEDEGERLSPEGRAHLDRVMANARRMAGLIDGLLLLSQVASAPLQRVRVDVSAMCAELLAELAAEESNRVMITTVEPGLVVQGDPTLLRAAFDNLLRNAYKFTRERAPGTIEIGRQQDELYVRDNGAGFDATYAAKLFQPFVRLHAERRFPGSGIGLATVERIVRRHGGGVRAEGVVEGGATFWVRLP